MEGGPLYLDIPPDVKKEPQPDVENDPPPPPPTTPRRKQSRPVKIGPQPDVENDPPPTKRKQRRPVILSDEHEEYMVEYLKEHEGIWGHHNRMNDRGFQDMKNKINMLQEAAEHVGRSGQ